MLMNYGKNRVLWVSNIKVMATWWPNILPPNPRIHKYINQSLRSHFSLYFNFRLYHNKYLRARSRSKVEFHLTKWHSLSSHLDMVKQDLLSCLHLSDKLASYLLDINSEIIRSWSLIWTLLWSMSDDTKCDKCL